MEFEAEGASIGLDKNFFVDSLINCMFRHVTLTARTKRQAEEAASTLAWEHLKSEGFVTPESLITAAAGGRSARPVWELPRQKCADNPLTFVEISIGGMAVGKIVVEWFVDVAPAVGLQRNGVCPESIKKVFTVQGKVR